MTYTSNARGDARERDVRFSELLGNGAEAAIPVDKARTLDSTGPMGGCARDERLLLDTALASWPLLLINGLLLVLVGYLLRGYTDRRARMRKRRVGSTT